MLEQQLAYVTQSEEKHQRNDFPVEGSSKDNNCELMSENDDDDESTILEQELYEQRQEEEKNKLFCCSKSGHEVELTKLLSDSQTPLSQILRSDYPGVLSEYLDLYDQLIQDEQAEFSSSDEATSSEDEGDELELMTPPESGNSLEISLDSLLSKNDTSNSINNLRIRDIQTLAEEADRHKPLKSSLRQLEVPHQKVIPFIRGDLRDYQRIGVDWLISMHKSKISGAIADEPRIREKNNDRRFSFVVVF
ncbi:EP400 [Lepeophtheirus salmonis]|nr:EP400 [Lepeophtheirus salmonis]CAF2755417.1 EP400 [Lepeophtheirus salmonis]